jgi:hypothetical protein
VKTDRIVTTRPILRMKMKLTNREIFARNAHYGIFRSLPKSDEIRSHAAFLARRLKVNNYVAVLAVAALAATDTNGMPTDSFRPQLGHPTLFGTVDETAFSA